MGTVLFPEPKDQQLFRDFYIRRYRARRPDVIIAVGPAPLKFMLETHREFFSGIPVVFCLPNRRPGNPITEPDFAGIESDIAPGRTVAAALRLLPGTKHLVVVGGTAPYDRGQQAEIKDQLQSYENRLDISYLTDLSLPVLLERLKTLPHHTIVLLTPFGKDAAGRTFTSGEIAPVIVSATNAPIFSLTDRYLNHGEVGGNISSGIEQGKLAGSIAGRLLNGEKAKDIPSVRTATAYTFDWKALDRWGLKERDLPPGSIVLNREPTAWELYKWYVVASLALIVVETFLILALLRQRKARKRSETYSRELVLRSPLAMVVTSGPNDTVQIANNKFTELFGYTMKDIPDEASWWPLAYPDAEYRETIKGEWRRRVNEAVLQGKDIEPLEATVRCKDGSTRYIEFHFGFLAGSKVVNFVDLTDRKQAEAEFAIANDRLRMAIEAGRFVGWDTDLRSGRNEWFGDLEGMFGIESDSYSARPGEFLTRVHPDDLDMVTKAIENARRNKQSYFAEFRIPRNDGTVRWVIARGEFYYEPSGEAIRMLGLAVNITDRRLAEQKLRESEQRFRLVANSAPVMIWMSGPDKLCTYFNQPWLEFTGRPLELELGNGWAEAVHPADIETCLQTYIESFDRRERFEMRYRLRRHDGEYRWLLDIGVPRFDSGGSFAGYIGSCLDVTERKRAEEALSTMGQRLIEAQEEERSRIGRELHDHVNQRLALLAVELDRLNYTGSTKHIQQQIQQVKGRVTEIATDVQALSHQLHSAKLEYLGLVAAAKSFCKEVSELQRVQVHFVYDGVPRSLPKDVSLAMFRVLQEALQNSVKHSGADHFEVQLLGNHGKLELTVRDHGTGFEVDKAMYGRSLGLISMRERVSALKGTIAVRSKPHRGTEVVACVPISADYPRGEAISGAA